jgi:K+-transporting ATPase ATPase A chain
MSLADGIQILLYFIILVILTPVMGRYLSKVFAGEPHFFKPVLGWLERVIYRLSGVDSTMETGWKSYLFNLLIFNFFGFVIVFLLEIYQQRLPLNPQHLPAVTWPLALNTAISFMTNTNWQSYSGETTMSYLVQMAGLAVQNFLSAATGMAVLLALIRGLTRKTSELIGNFWVDLTRTVVYVLLPLSIILAVVLAGQGVVQSLSPYVKATPLQGAHQTIPLGPAASQIAIKQLGTNGGGFFNVNSSHPFENPTPLSNFAEMLSILLIPAALCCTFGRLVGDTRQGWALLAAMTIVFTVFLTVAVWAEQTGNPALSALGVDQTASAMQSGGNMEGKEVRFGIANSALWATATTAASNGSVNSMHDSYTPLGGLVPLLLIDLGEIIYGGVGSGLYGMLAFVIVAVFVAGLMVGRTPEYLGKKIEAFEMKMASLMILIPVLLVLIGTAVAVATPVGRTTIGNPGAHGFSEVLYAFSSAGNNNGSAFAGLGANTPFYNTALGIAMLFARYWLAIPALAIAGSLAKKKVVPAGSGTLATHTPLFIAWLIGVIAVVGALSFLPALALGPIVEHLSLFG